MNEVIEFPGQPPQRSERLQPLKAAEVVTLLARSLALVRPTGMSDDAAHEWLTAAAAEVRHLPKGVLERAAEKARRTCTHPAQIVPAILNSSEVAEDRATEALTWDRAVHQQPRLEAPRWKPEPGETAAIIAEAAAKLKGA